LKSFIKNTLIYKAYNQHRHKKLYQGITKIEILDKFPLFAARGWGYYEKKSKLTIQSINQTIPALSQFCELSESNKEFKTEVLSFLSEQNSKNALGLLLDKYGSDKASIHNYHFWFVPANLVVPIQQTTYD